jgi:two-component system phosphate regulon sensor histidine kinase PhoR
MQEGVMVVDAQHVIRLVNPSFRQLFDVKLEPVGETVLVVLRDVVFEEIVTAALRTGDPQVREVSRNGSKPLRHFDINAVSMRDSAGQAAVVMIFRDISRLKQLEDVRREFVANVSHELRTPLSIFHGYLETILDQPKMPRQETREILEIMRKHSLRLNALLEDLLILARLESRGERLRLEAIDIAKFAPEIAADWALPSSQKKIAIDVQVEPGLPPLRADSLRLAQVLNNLATR